MKENTGITEVCCSSSSTVVMVNHTVTHVTLYVFFGFFLTLYKYYDFKLVAIVQRQNSSCSI